MIKIRQECMGSGSMDFTLVILLPADAELFHIGAHNGFAWLWFRFDDAKPMVEHRFRAPVAHGDARTLGAYVTTVYAEHGPVHVFREDPILVRRL